MDDVDVDRKDSSFDRDCTPPNMDADRPLKRSRVYPPNMYSDIPARFLNQSSELESLVQTQQHLRLSKRCSDKRSQNLPTTAADKDLLSLTHGVKEIKLY